MEKEFLSLNAKQRDSVHYSLNALRKSGFLPAVIYGHKFPSTPIQVNYKEFEKVYKKAGESTLINLKIGDRSELVVIKEVQIDPVKEKFIHIDFYRVKMEEKIRARIPLLFVGESEAVKAGGILVKPINELEIETLPQDLIHEIKVDISKLKNFGDEILIEDIPIKGEIKILADPKEVVALVQEPKKEEKEEIPAGIEEVEIIKKEEEEKKEEI